MVDLKKTLKFAENLAKKVGLFLLENQNKVEVLKFKDRQDILTNIDLQAEGIILDALKRKFPQHSILSEEKGLVEKKSPYQWIIDPLDGTKEYLRGMTLFNTALALEKNEETVLAIVYRPCGDDLFSAAKGLGAFHNNRPISPSGQGKLVNSFIYTYLPSYKMGPRFSKAWEQLGLIAQNCYRLRSIAEAGPALCWVANGACEAYVTNSNAHEWWDIAPGLFIAQEANAKITDICGKPIKNKDLSKGLIVSNGKIHQQLIKILS